jgi:tetratricopeptide (TPR) repeat protein
MPRSLGFYAVPLLLIMAGLASAGDAEWMEIRSPHFSVVTDAGEKRGRDVAARFEQMRSVFGSLLATAKVNIPVPLQIVAFRNTKEMRQYVPLWRGKPIQAAGLFEGNNDRSFIMLDMSSESPWQVVFHEYAHQLLNGNTNGEVQPWFDEGFAEFFSTIKVNGKEADVGLLSQINVEILQQNGWLRVADLFRVRQNSSIYNETGDRRSVFYAESWLVFHYLFDNKLIPKLDPYFTLAVDQGVPIEGAIQQAFGMSAPDFDKALRKYFTGNHSLYYKIPAPVSIENNAFTAKPLTIPDAKVVLADMHVHSSDYQDKAIAEFQEVINVQPENAAALRGLGYAYLLKQDFAQASEYFNRAVAHDSEDPRVLYYSALLVQREGDLLAGGDKVNLTQSRLEKSIRLDPEFADAYNLLAFAYAAQNRPEEALKMMQTAVHLNRRNEGYYLNLAQLYVMNRKFDDAISILTQLTKVSNAQMVAQAEQMLPGVETAKRAVASDAQLVFKNGTAPALRKPEPSIPEPNDTGPEPEPTSSAAKFLKGTLVRVDCSPMPGAMLNVTSGGKTWIFRAKDIEHTIVVGADNLSCDLVNRRVAINYRETTPGAGDIISIELQ